MSKQSTTPEFIKKSIAIHGNKYSYENVFYKKAIVKVSITCLSHGEFLQTPNSHLNGNGCPLCGRKNISLARSNRTIVNCIVCGNGISKNQYRLKLTNRHLCSPECWSKWARESGAFRGENNPTWKGGVPKVPCTMCGNIIERDRSKIKRNKNFFCSRECQNGYLSSHASVKDYPRRKGLGVRGGTVEVQCYTCKKTLVRERNTLKRRKLAFCDRTCWAAWRRSGAWSGENNPTWKHDMPDGDRYWRTHIEPGLNTWIKRVKERDGYTCQVCGIKEYEMIAHHINSWNTFPDLRVVLDNGVCLCESCHDVFHKLYGRGGNTRVQFDEFSEKYRNGINLQPSL